MADYEDQIYELLDRVDGLPHGPAQVAVAEEAMRLADRHGDVQVAFAARLKYVNATMFAGQPDRMLVAYAWLLAQSDRDPESFDLHELLWQYKWVVGVLPNFPQISRQQIEEMLRDMERRYEAIGASLQVVMNKRRAVYVLMGDRAGAEAAHGEIARHVRDELSDCKACEIDEEVEYNFFIGDPERGVQRARPILRGDVACAEVPHLTYAQLLQPLLQLGRGEDAMQHHLAGYRLISSNPAEFIKSLSQHIEFLTLTDNLQRAGKLLEKHLSLALDTNCLAWRFDMYLAAKLFFERLGDRACQTIKIRLPDYFPLYNEMGAYRVSELAGWFQQRLEELGQRFDARNGNDYHRRRIAAVAQARQRITPVSLPARESDSAPPPSRWQK